MADNFGVATTTSIQSAADDIGGVLYPRVKVNFGADGTVSEVSGSAPLPVTLVGAGTTTVIVNGTPAVSVVGTVPVSVGGTVPVSFAGTQAVIISGTPTVTNNFGTSSGTLSVTLATLLAGEDLTNNVTKVEQRFSPHYIGTAGTTVVKTNAAGFLHTMTVTGGSAGVITGYDSASGTSASKLFDFDSTNALNTYRFDYTFVNGLVIVTGAATKLSISYR